MATVLSGNWTASSGSDGTVYTSGRRVVSGGVSLKGSNTVLRVSSGAVASDLTNPSSAANARYISAYVSDGGSIVGGKLNEVVIYQNSGSVVSGGTYDHGQFHDSGGTISNVTLTYGFISALSGATVKNVSQTSGYVTVGNGGVVTDLTKKGGSVSVGGGGQLVSGSLSSGAVATVTGTGKASDTTLSSGTTLVISKGGTTSGAVIGQGASERVGLSGSQAAAVQGNDIDTTILSGGTETLYNRGVSIGAVVSRGGQISAGVWNAGASSTSNLTVVSSATVYAGGTIRAQNDTRVTGTVLSGGSLNLAQEGADGSGTVILSGGVETLNDRYVAARGDYIYGGGTLNIAKSNYTINGDHLYYHGTVDFSYLGGRLVSANMSTRDLLTVTASNGKKASIQFASSQYTGNDVFILDGDAATLICFLEGTQIDTPTGERAVETLTTGDMVLTWDWREGRVVEKRLAWVGRQSWRVKPGLADDLAGYPVRIRAGAISPGVPHKDLLVTPEHCLFVDNGFIPARMLVNGSSIVYDRTMTRFSVFHIETAEHAVLWSDGMLSESYLDTGNRRDFTQIGGDATVLGRVRDWTCNAAAPLMVARDLVEPIFTRFAERAAELGFDEAGHGAAMIEDPDLHLVTQSGQVVRAFRHSKTRALFHIPAGTETVRVVSRASRPADTIGPFVDDRRMLGVLTGRVVLFAEQTVELSAYLRDAGPSGWHGVENAPCRWTDGNAHLSLERDTSLLDEAVLSVEILAAGPYLAESAPDTAQAIRISA